LAFLADMVDDVNQFIDMLEAGRVTSMTLAHGAEQTY
jgi:hypothetical protein